MGTSRATLRRTVGGLCGDMLVCTATSDGADTTHFEDTVNLAAGDDALIGRQVFYASASVANAANLYTTRRVTDNAESTGIITVNAAWSAAPDTGDVIELFSSRGVSPSPQQIHDKLNDLIREVADLHLTVVDDTPVSFDSLDPYIDLPSTWIGLVGVQYADSASVTHTLARADYRLHKNLGTYGQVEIGPAMRGRVDGCSAWLVGVTPASALTSDTSTTIVHPGWLTKQAAGELLVQNARAYEDTAGAERRGNLWLTQAAALYPRAQVRPPANYQRLNRT